MTPSEFHPGRGVPCFITSPPIPFPFIYTISLLPHYSSNLPLSILHPVDGFPKLREILVTTVPSLQNPHPMQPESHPDPPRSPMEIFGEATVLPRAMALYSPFLLRQWTSLDCPDSTHMYANTFPAQVLDSTNNSVAASRILSPSPTRHL